MMRGSAAFLLWVIAPRHMGIAVLVLVLVGSAFFVSLSSHQTRELYRNLHIIQKQRDDLDYEYQKLILERGDELKLVHPQNCINPESYENLNFDNFYLQPMDGPQLESNTKHVIEFCRRNPMWKVSLQTHKFLDIP